MATLELCAGFPSCLNQGGRKLTLSLWITICGVCRLACGFTRAACPAAGGARPRRGTCRGRSAVRSGRDFSVRAPSQAGPKRMHFVMPSAPHPQRPGAPWAAPRASYLIFHVLLVSLVPLLLIFHILLVSLVRKRFGKETSSSLRVIRVICKNKE